MIELCRGTGYHTVVVPHRRHFAAVVDDLNVIRLSPRYTCITPVHQLAAPRPRWLRMTPDALSPSGGAHPGYPEGRKRKGAGLFFLILAETAPGASASQPFGVLLAVNTAVNCVL